MESRDPVKDLKALGIKQSITISSKEVIVPLIHSIGAASPCVQFWVQQYKCNNGKELECVQRRAAKLMKGLVGRTYERSG